MGLYHPEDAGKAAGAAFGGGNPEQVTAKVLTALHPLYLKFFSTWVMLLDFYEGLNLGQYIDRHIRESTDSHAARVHRLCYRNYSAPVSDLYGHHVFAKPISRKSETRDAIAEEWEEEFQKDVDGRGTSIDRWMQDFTTWVRVFGFAHILTDMPALDETKVPQNEAERRTQRLRPYWVCYFPTETINWELDANGELLWIRFREPTSGKTGPFDPRSGIDQRSIDPAFSAGNRLEQAEAQSRQRRKEPAGARIAHAVYRTWTRTHWAVHEVKGDQVTCLGSNAHPVGRVPVSTVFYKKMARNPELGLSLLHDIVRLNKTLLNIDSLIDEAVYQQTINILCMGRQPTDEDEIRIGTNNVLEFSGDRAPFFLTPSTAPVSFMESRIQGIREEIYRSAKLGGGMGLEPRSAASGVVAAFDFNESNRTLADHAEAIQSGERHAHEDYFRWQNSDFRGMIDYADDFAVESFDEELRKITTAGSAIRSPTLRRELEKRAADRLLPNVDPKVKQQVKEEIDFIPEMISTFSGPIFHDPVSQQVKMPQDPNPIGRLGDIVAALEKETGEPQTPGTANRTNEESAADQQADAQAQGQPPAGPQPQAA